MNLSTTSSRAMSPIKQNTRATSASTVASRGPSAAIATHITNSVTAGLVIVSMSGCGDTRVHQLTMATTNVVTSAAASTASVSDPTAHVNAFATVAVAPARS